MTEERDLRDAVADGGPLTAPALATAPRRLAVVVVDAEGVDRHRLAEVLRQRGARVTQVPILHDAIELLDVPGSVVDVVVLDSAESPPAELVEAVRASSPVPLVLHGPAGGLPPGLDDAATVVLADTTDPTAAAVAIEGAAGLTVPPPQVPDAVVDLSTSADARALAAAVVTSLPSWTGIRTWMFTRVVGDDWFVLAAADGGGFGVAAGDVLRWSDSFCCRMVEGRGPRIVCDTAEDRSYADAPINQHLAIGTYVGIPVVTADHGLFGTLCGIDPDAHPDPPGLRALRPAIELVARSLAACVALDLERARLQRRLDLTEVAARSDSLTGLGNRRSWTLALRAEDARCDRFGHRAAVVVIDLDGLKQVNDEQGHRVGDDLLRRAASVLRGSLREADQAFRTGGDEFAVLLPETDRTAAGVVLGRLRAAFERAGVGASFGLAVRSAGTTLEAAAHAADVLMYESKRLH